MRVVSTRKHSSEEVHTNQWRIFGWDGAGLYVPDLRGCGSGGYGRGVCTRYLKIWRYVTFLRLKLKLPCDACARMLFGTRKTLLVRNTFNPTICAICAII